MWSRGFGGFCGTETEEDVEVVLSWAIDSAFLFDISLFRFGAGGVEVDGRFGGGGTGRGGGEVRGCWAIDSAILFDNSLVLFGPGGVEVDGSFGGGGTGGGGGGGKGGSGRETCLCQS
jgi:hypothetical protein